MPAKRKSGRWMRTADRSVTDRMRLRTELGEQMRERSAVKARAKAADTGTPAAAAVARAARNAAQAGRRSPGGPTGPLRAGSPSDDRPPPVPGLGSLPGQVPPLRRAPGLIWDGGPEADTGRQSEGKRLPPCGGPVPTPLRCSRDSPQLTSLNRGEVSPRGRVTCGDPHLYLSCRAGVVPSGVSDGSRSDRQGDG